MLNTIIHQYFINMAENEPTKVCSKCGPVGHDDENCPKKNVEVSQTDTRTNQALELESVNNLDNEAVKNFFIAFWNNQETAVKDPEQKRRLALEMAERVRQEQDSSHFLYVVRKDYNIVGTGKLDIKTDEKGDKRGFLSCLTVQPEERGKKYGGKKLYEELTDVRVKRAQEEGCKYLDAEVFSKNPEVVKALAVKFKENYKLIGINPYGQGDKKYEMGAYLLSKRIDGKEIGVLSNEEMRVPLADLAKVDEIIQLGYQGVAIEGDEIVLKK